MVDLFHAWWHFKKYFSSHLMPEWTTLFVMLFKFVLGKILIKNLAATFLLTGVVPKMLSWRQLGTDIKLAWTCTSAKVVYWAFVAISRDLSVHETYLQSSGRVIMSVVALASWTLNCWVEVHLKRDMCNVPLYTLVIITMHAYLDNPKINLALKCPTHTH